MLYKDCKFKGKKSFTESTVKSVHEIVGKVFFNFKEFNQLKVRDYIESMLNNLEFDKREKVFIDSIENIPISIQDLAFMTYDHILENQELFL